MSETVANVYAPPQANLQAQEDADTQEMMFYVVSRRKFLLLFLATMGMYAIYWTYRNWRAYKAASGESLWPAVRGVFLVFFTHSLFRHVDEALQRRHLDVKWSAGGDATLIVVITILSNFMDRLGSRMPDTPLLDMISILLLVPLAYLYLRAQTAINTACGDPEGSGNAGYSAANWLFLVIGGIFWVFIAIGVGSMVLR